MATYTSNYNLKKPDGTDYADIQDINGNMDTLDAALMRYATCSTAAATAAKTVELIGFELHAGAVILIKFTVTDTSINPTLNVNNTGAKPIQYRGATIFRTCLAAERVYAFVYDGAAYQLVGDVNTDTTYKVFTGSTASAAGKAGLVPIPAAGDQEKLLRGDGTWAEAGGMNLDALANNTGTVTIQGAGANSVNAVNLCQKNTAYSDMIQTLEMNSMNGPPGRLFRMLIKQGNNPNGTEGTDYGGLRLFTNFTQKSGSLEPLINNAYSLGNSSQKWSAVYATNGTIQTSDVREKSDVKKIPQGGTNNSVAVMRALSADETESQDVTYDDILDFLKNIDIYTYVSDPTHTETVQDAISANQFDKTHIGIIANDIVDSKLFPFVAYKNTEDENAILGMKYNSLGVLALYAIRDLYSKVETLETEVAQLKGQIKL